MAGITWRASRLAADRRRCMELALSRVAVATRLVGALRGDARPFLTFSTISTFLALPPGLLALLCVFLQRTSSVPAIDGVVVVAEDVPRGG